MKKIKTSILCILILLALITLTRHKGVLIIREMDQLVSIHEIYDGDNIEIAQIHSVSKTWVREVFVYDNNKLVHRLSAYEDEGGAGMPVAKTPDDEFIYMSNGTFQIVRNDIMETPIQFFVNTIDAWVLSVKNYKYHPHGKEIKIEVKSISNGHYLLLKIRCKYEI